MPKTRPLPWFLLLALTALPACSGGGVWPRNAIWHPTPDNLPAPGGPLVRADTIITGVTGERSAEWAAARRALLDARTVTRVGVLSGSGPDRLGFVGDAARDDEGNVYIQDNSTEEIRVFSATGDFLHSIGGEGEGPEEIRSFLRFPDGRLVVNDVRGPTRMFEPANGSYRAVESLPLDEWTEGMAPLDMCTVDDRVFVHTILKTHENTVIHEVSAEFDDVVGSFGDVYRAPVSVVRSTRSRGFITCAGEPATVVYGMYYFPFVKAYRPDNTLLWTAQIEDHVQGPIWQARRDEATVHPRGLPTEYILGVHALEPGFVVVQTGYYERPFPDQEWHMVRRRTYLLDRATGNGGLVSDNLPRILWIGDASFVAAWSDPYAKVEVRALSSLEP